MTDYAAEAASALIKAECEAAMCQCSQGHQSGSNFFNENVIGEEMLHAGAYIMVICECFNRISLRKGDQVEKRIDECRRCISILNQIAPVLIQLLLHESSEASSYLDPRPTIAEAWFLTMASLVSICRSNEQITASLLGNNIESLFGDSLYTATRLIFLKDLGSRKTAPPTIQKGMSLDGPQTLALMEFTSEAMLLGSNILSAAAKSTLAHIQLYATGENTSADALGAAIIAAGLLRAASGALPPWAVELTPTLLRSMYIALGSNCDALIHILNISTTLQTAISFGGVNAGQKLAGRYFEKMNPTTMESFLSKSREACVKGKGLFIDVFVVKSTSLSKGSLHFVFR